jgi:hypothetical protein
VIPGCLLGASWVLAGASWGFLVASWSVPAAFRWVLGATQGFLGLLGVC